MKRSFSRSTELSGDSKDWYCEILKPKDVKLPNGDKYVQKSFIFKNTKGTICQKDCPYAYPVWDGTIGPVNDVLAFIGLPPVQALKYVGDWYYTDPKYSEGEILIEKGKYFDHISKIIVKYR